MAEDESDRRLILRLLRFEKEDSSEEKGGQNERFRHPSNSEPNGKDCFIA